MRRAPVGLAGVVLLLMAGMTPAVGQDSTGQPDSPQRADELGVVRAPVIIDGAELFYVRGVTTFPAERRAAEIAGRIMRLARDPAIVATSLKLEEHPEGTWILANGQRITVVLEEDAALEAIDRGVLAEIYRTRIWDTIQAYRAARQPAVLWRNILLTLSATLALFVFAYIVRRIFGWLQARLARRYEGRVGEVSIQSFRVVKAEHFWRAVAGILTFIWGFLVVAMLLAYLSYVLGLFPWTRGMGSQVVNMAIDPMRSLGLGLVSAIPNLVFLAILFIVIRYALNLLRLFFDSVAAGTVRLRNFESEWAAPTFKLIRLLVIALAVVVAYPYVPGSDTEAFKGLTLFLGVVFSLGSSSLVGNVISGFSMTYRRTFRIGDLVRIGDHVGEVREMRLLVTHLRSPKNEEVIVPNSSIVSTEVVNYSTLARDRGLILHTTVGIGYETPWRQVEAMLIEAAARTPGLLRDPAPFVFQTSLGDFCVTYEINVYCDAPGRMRALYAELHRSILDVFNEYGVQIMTPAYEGDPPEPKVVARERWFAEPARPPAKAPAAETRGTSI